MVARHLRVHASPAFSVLEMDGDPMALLDAWEGRGEVILADAIRGGGRAGTVRRLDGRHPLPVDLRHPSSHAMGVAETVELARALGRLPASLVIFCIEGSEFSVGSPMTPGVAAAVPLASARILEEIRR